MVTNSIVKMIENAFKPTNLRTEMRSEAYGISTKNPSFSWIVKTDIVDDYQTSYRILVSSTRELKGDVIDSGWIESKESSFVHFPELSTKLKDNQIYYWQVQIKNKNGTESILSDPSSFMTDISTEWKSLDGIWSPPNSSIKKWKNYSIFANINIQSGGALGILIRIDNDKNGYLVQVRDADNVIKCHTIKKSVIDVNPFQVIQLSEYGIKLPDDKSDFKIKISVADDKMNIFIDLGNGYVDCGTVNLGQSFVEFGKIGFRTGRTESGQVNDLLIKDTKEEILYQSDFSSDDGFFKGCVVSDGKLLVGNQVFSVLNDPNHLQERGNITFIRSPKIWVLNQTFIDKAIISATSRGTAIDRGTIFDLFFNGKSIGAGSARELGNVGSFSTGNKGYTQVYYNSFDVTELLNQGDQNVISAVGNCRDSNRGILIQMTFFYINGIKEVVANSGMKNSGWKTLDGTNAFGDEGELIATGYVNLFHDNINMENYPSGWNSINFDDSKWLEAEISQPVAENKSGEEGRVLYPFPSENVLRIETNEPKKRFFINNFENVVIDLGKEIIGGLKVNIQSNCIQKITVYMGEEMESDGSVRHKLTAAPDYVDHWTLINGKNEFETITFRNFRYVELVGLNEETKEMIVNDLDSVKGWAIQQPFDENDSYFEASGSDEALLLNILYDFCKYTIKATNQDVFVDSQARERAPYEGDLLVNSNTSYSIHSNYSLARHSNEWLIDNPTWPNDYTLFSIEMSYWDFMYTGNSDSIEKYFNALEKKLTTKVVYEDEKTGLIYVDSGGQAGHTALIDWPVGERDGYVESYYDVILNSEYVAMYRYMSQICDYLNKKEESKKYQLKAEKLSKTLIEIAYDKINGCFFDSISKDLQATRHSSTHATAYSLSYGIFDSQEMANSMCSFVYEKCKDEFKGSVYVAYFILKGLFVGNRGDLAVKLMTNPRVGKDLKTFVSLLIDLKCTITPEAWGHKHKNNMTLSHPWGAAPGCSIVQGMFGIMPTKSGFDEFSIKLQPSGIPEAKIKAPTVKGPVLVSYKNGSEIDCKENKLEIEVEIPFNSKSVVYVPVHGTELKSLIIDGVVTEAEYEDGFLKAILGSGNHTISLGRQQNSHCFIF